MDIQEIQEKFEDLLLANPDFDESLLGKDEEGCYSDSDIQHMYSMFEAGTEVREQWQAAKAQAVPEGFVVCKSEPVAYIVQNKFWKQKFDVKSVKDMPPQKWEDDHYDVEIPLYAVSLDGLVLKEQDEDEAND